MKTLTLKAVLVNRSGPHGEPLPHLRLIDTSTGSIYEVLNVDRLPPAWRDRSTTRHEATIAIEIE